MKSIEELLEAFESQPSPYDKTRKPEPKPPHPTTPLRAPRRWLEDDGRWVEIDIAF